MSEMFAPVRAEPTVEDVLRQELAQGDAVIGTIAPILRHLLANDDHSLFNDEIVARVRGMIDHVARQVLDAVEDAQGGGARHEHDQDLVAQVIAAVIERSALLGHVHAQALEFQLTERLQGRIALDPVLSPLLQALIASPDAGTAASAMGLLAAQARFVQAQRRMQLPLGELPADLFHAVLQALRSLEAEPEVLVAAEKTLRAGYDEGRSRLGLMARLVLGMGGGATAALDVSHAGVGLFLTALSLGAGQDRDLTALAAHEGQLARLALALRAAGVRPEAIEGQFLAIHPDVSLPEGFEAFGADHAAALLARSFAGPGR
ncbi:MAG: hypothetical protein U9R07_16260 [Pseudomonadota bacterium]|nr:hypothetical protein [Pseudomonadota bacterium]